MVGLKRLNKLVYNKDSGALMASYTLDRIRGGFIRGLKKSRRRLQIRYLRHSCLKWLATIRNVRTAIMTSNEDIFIPELVLC
ncbi:hypothetical protein ACFLQQ_00630 [Actinomycetota bacterium]